MDRPERTPELNEHYRALFVEFQRSPECTQAQCGAARWLESFLDIHTACDWKLDELDIYGLSAALFDGMGWTINAPPTDADAVARELLAFLRWAVRIGHAKATSDYLECCEYLASAEARHDIATQLQVIEISWHGAWNAP